MITTLKDINFPRRRALTRKLHALHRKTPADSAYLQSMDLLISSGLGVDTIYQDSWRKMAEAFKEMPDSSFKAWMLGRKYKSATEMKDFPRDVETANKIIDLLYGEQGAVLFDGFQSLRGKGPHLYDLIPNTKAEKDALACWGAAYLARGMLGALGINIDPRNKYGPGLYLMNTAVFVTAEYQCYKESYPEDSKKITEMATNVGWCWVMAMDAAAYIGTKHDFDFARATLLIASGENALGPALLKLLQPTDYPAWALSLMRQALDKMGYDDEFRQLEKPYRDALKATKAAGNQAEVMLAEINEQITMRNRRERLLSAQMHRPARRQALAA